MLIQKKIKKIRPQRPKEAYNEIFVKNEAHISRYETRVHELFEQGVQVVLIHGLQASIEKCVRLALTVVEYYNDVTYRVRTSTQAVE